MALQLNVCVDKFAGSILDAEWVFEVTPGSTSSPDDFGAVAVIDGSEYNLLQSSEAF
jgi:hypothetical protein